MSKYHEINDATVENQVQRRSAEELRAYREEYDGMTVNSSNIPEDWEVDLFTVDEQAQFEEARKTNRKNEFKRKTGILGIARGGTSGGTPSRFREIPFSSCFVAGKSFFPCR